MASIGQEAIELLFIKQREIDLRRTDRVYRRRSRDRSQVHVLAELTKNHRRIAFSASEPAASLTLR